MYGWAKASDDANAAGSATRQSYLWWLDVETENTWQADKAANVAVLEGMTAYFQEDRRPRGPLLHRLPVGEIAGTVKSTSPLAGLPSWLAGARSAAGAKANCALPGANAAQPRLDDAVHLRRPRLQPLVQLTR